MYECAKNNAHNVDLNWSSEGFSQKSAYLLDLIKKKKKIKVVIKHWNILPTSEKWRVVVNRV